MFNYPIEITNVGPAGPTIFFGDKLSKGEIYSKVELKESDSDFGLRIKFNRMGNPTRLFTGKIYVYDVWYNANFSLDQEESKLWAELAISKKNFPLSLDWIKFPETSILPKIVDKLETRLSPTQMQVLIGEILSRPEESWVDYIESQILWMGVSEVFRFRFELDMMKLKDPIDFRYQRRYKIVNKHNFENIDKYAYSCNSLVDKFLILTDGFNQCFKHDKEYYSSVAVCETNYGDNSKYSIYIYGCDDSSYTKYCATKEEAIQEADKLTRVSKIISKYHMQQLGYEFTN